MMRISLSVILLSWFYLVKGQALDFDWSKQFGAAGAHATGRSITIDPWGNVFT